MDEKQNHIYGEEGTAVTRNVHPFDAGEEKN